MLAITGRRPDDELICKDQMWCAVIAQDECTVRKVAPRQAMEPPAMRALHDSLVVKPPVHVPG